MDSSIFPVIAESRIVVIGGGPAGVSAALAAARSGFPTLLMEQGGCLGGMATSGLVPMFAPCSDGERMIYGGLFAEINGRMCEMMGTRPAPESWQAINPEILKRLLDDMMEEAGVQTLFCSKLCGADLADGIISAIWLATSSGIVRVAGKQFIDATGDAMLAMFAGNRFDCGDENGATMSPTLCAQFANIDYKLHDAAVRNGISDRRIWFEMLAKGNSPLDEHHFVCMKKITSSSASSNLGHIYGCNPMDIKSLSKAYVEGRRIAGIFERFYREHVPGFENSVLTSTASMLGIRETRRIRGVYRMTVDDFIQQKSFPDEIGRCCYPIDIHSSSDDPDTQRQVEVTLASTRFKHGESYGIPFRSMIPDNTRNLLVPGRALAADRHIQSSLRIMPACCVTGQAAGIAAGLAGGDDCENVDISLLQDKLREIGAVIHTHPQHKEIKI